MLHFFNMHTVIGRNMDIFSKKSMIQIYLQYCDYFHTANAMHKEGEISPSFTHTPPHPDSYITAPQFSSTYESIQHVALVVLLVVPTRNTAGTQDTSPLAAIRS
jgi:hypothetical protein